MTMRMKNHMAQVASIAIGQRYGIAKKATLVSSKFTENFTDRLEAIRDLCWDIVNTPGRLKRSVVVLCWGLAVEGTVSGHDGLDEDADTLEDAV
jgi:hypothetical protein